MSRNLFWRGVLTELEAGHRVLLAWVTRATEHSPGTRGACLFLSASGARQGTIGGGIMEKKLEDRAREILAAPWTGFFERRTLHHRREGEGERSGMICAGSQENLLLLLRPEQDLPAVRDLYDRLDSGEEGFLTLGEQGLAVVSEAAAIPPGVYSEPLQNPRRVAIFGGGHCGQALARQMSLLGYGVLLFETRTAVLPADAASLGPGVVVRVVADFREAAAEVERPEKTPVVVMTTDFPNDVKALEGALRRAFPFCGVMGSQAKLREIEARLRDLGFGDEDLQRLEAPVGLPIGSHTPAEIAVSIAAQILALRPRWE